MRLGTSLKLTELRRVIGGGGGPSEVVNVKVGSFTTPGSAGNQAITGLGFQPKGIIFFSAHVSTEDSVQVHDSLSLGFSDGSNDRVGYHFSRDNLSSSDCNREFRNDACGLGYALGTVSLLTKFSLVSLDADGFTINYSTSGSSAVEFYYIAYGGDVTVEVGSFDTPNTPGIQNVSTGIANADFLMLISGMGGTGNENALGATSLFHMGVATGPANEGHTSSRANDNQSPTVTEKFQATDSIYSLLNGSGGLIDEAQFNGFTGSGFDLNYITKDGTVRRIYYLTIKGGQWEVGNDTSRTSAGIKATTTSFQPKGLGILGHSAASSGSVTAISKHTFGVSDETNDRCSAGIDLDNVGTSDCARINQTDEVISAFTGTGSVAEEANVDSFNPTDFTLNYGVADATAREFIWWVCGDN